MRSPFVNDTLLWYYIFVPHQTFEPLELIPTDAIPSYDILMSGIAQPPGPPDRDYSDLFPQDYYSHFQGPLGRYMGGDPQVGHPLYTATQGLSAAYYSFAQQERDNDFRRTETTSQGLSATMLQKHIVRCIAKGYDNLLEQTDSATAIETIGHYIDGQDVDRATAYNNALDYHTNELAALDRGDEEPTPTEINGIPVISGRDVALAMGEIPESAEVEREQRKEWAQKQINVVRKRLVRLPFEYMSAKALTDLLGRAV